VLREVYRKVDKPNITPMGRRVLIEPIRTNPKTDGGIYLPETKNTFEATVVAIGDEVTLMAPGDRVVWDQFDGIKVSDDLLLVKEDSILCQILP